MIEANREFIREGREEAKEGIPISSIAKRHFQLQTETLQNAPRDVAKLRQIIKAKEGQNEETSDFKDTQRLLAGSTFIISTRFNVRGRRTSAAVLQGRMLPSSTLF